MSGNPGWLTEQSINVPNPANISLSGTLNFTNDVFNAAGAENLKAQIEMSDFSQAVADPSTLLFLGSGLIGLWGLRKKFKK